LRIDAEGDPFNERTLSIPPRCYHRRSTRRQNRKTRGNGRGRSHGRLIFVSRDIPRTRSIDLPFARIQYARARAHAPAAKRLPDRRSEPRAIGGGRGRGRNGRPRCTIKFKSIPSRRGERGERHVPRHLPSTSIQLPVPRADRLDESNDEIAQLTFQRTTYGVYVRIV